jgi:uncharacterized protein YeaO (DUF488 family)
MDVVASVSLIGNIHLKTAMGIKVKRAFDLAAADDGERVLVDRYWPRGLQRHHGLVHDWCRDVAPSPELIAWFGHRPERWEEFKQRYRDELALPPGAEALERLRERATSGELTLLYGSRDRELNAAQALAEIVAPEEVRRHTEYGRRELAARQVYGTQPRFQMLRFMDWGWIAFGLAVPLVLLGGGALMVAYGGKGVLAILTLIILLCTTTLARVAVQERRQQRSMGDLPSGSDGRASILVPVQELGLALFGYVLGFAGLVVVLFGAWYLGKLVG